MSVIVFDKNGIRFNFSYKAQDNVSNWSVRCLYNKYSYSNKNVDFSPFTVSPINIRGLFNYPSTLEAFEDYIELSFFVDLGGYEIKIHLNRDSDEIQDLKIAVQTLSEKIRALEKTISDNVSHNKYYMVQIDLTKFGLHFRTTTKNHKHLAEFLNFWWRYIKDKFLYMHNGNVYISDNCINTAKCQSIEQTFETFRKTMSLGNCFEKTNSGPKRKWSNLLADTNTVIPITVYVCMYLDKDGNVVDSLSSILTPIEINESLLIHPIHLGQLVVRKVPLKYEMTKKNTDILANQILKLNNRLDGLKWWYNTLSWDAETIIIIYNEIS